MDWENERYVRLYVRDTVEWEMLRWEARALFPQILRKLDRAGRLALGRHGARGLAALVKLPIEVVQPGLEGVGGLLEDGCVVIRDDVLVMPNYVAAQEAKKSDRLRKQEERDRKKASGARDGHQPSERVANRDEPSRNVTENHAPSDVARAVPDASRSVTPSLAEPSRAEPSQIKGVGEPAQDEGGAAELIPPEIDPDRLTPERFVALWNEATGGRIAKIEKPRREAIRKAIARQPELAFWLRCFAKAAEQRQVQDTEWLDLDWVLGAKKGAPNAERLEAGGLNFRLAQAGRQRDLRSGYVHHGPEDDAKFTRSGDVTHEF